MISWKTELKKYRFLGYVSLVNIDLYKIPVLLVYDMMSFEKVDFWLTYAMAYCKSGL